MKRIPSLLLLLFACCFWSLAEAQAGITLLVKTDMSCNWKLDGQSMGLLKADDSIVVLVSPGEHLIEASTIDRVTTVRTKVRVDTVEKTVAIDLKRKNDQQLKMQHDETARERTGAAPTATWTDPTTELMWTRNDNGSDVDWYQAGDYCSKLQLAGYDGWRLPSMDELQGIYDPSVSAREFIVMGSQYEVYVKGSLKLTGRVWSGLQGDLPGKPDQWAWHLGFGNGPLTDYDAPKPQRNFVHFKWNMRALCVRRAEE